MASEIQSLKKLVAANNLGHVLETENLRYFVASSDHTDRCTSHMHGPCDCGYDEIVELVEG